MTTIYISTTVAQATWSFLNRAEAFRRGFETTSDNSLTGYANRADAIAAGQAKYLREFAVLRITFDSTMHESLAWQGKLVGRNQQWFVNASGLETLAASDAVEMTMEILPGSDRVNERKNPLADGIVGPLLCGC